MKYTPLFLALAACSAPASSDPPAPVVTYQGAVRAIFEKHCNNCHAPGGIAPFALDSYASAKQYASLAAPAMEQRLMPPWLPDPTCRSYNGERLVPEQEIEQVRAWFDGGMLEGDPATYVAPSPAGETGRSLEAPTVVLKSPVAYLPKADTADDYRCFPLEKAFDRETYLIGIRARPDRDELVHHVLLFLIGPNQTATLERKDAAEIGPGYTCFGGPGIGAPQTLGGWAPGSSGTYQPEGTAIRIPAGSRLVMQIHYNLTSGRPVADQTEMELWLTEEQPQYLIEVRPLPHLAIAISAGDPASKQTRLFRNTGIEPWIVVGTAPHMHLLGTKITATHVAANGAENCLVDIPRWDFHWQQSYRFLPDQRVVVRPGESVRLDCTYDNSPANQPFVEGIQNPPRDVKWGEGTFDEMCLNYLALVEPYQPLPSNADVCPTFQGCYDTCRANGGAVFGSPMICALQCSSSDGEDCAQCVVPAVGTCVIEDCPQELGAFADCLESCSVERDRDNCAAQRCQGQILSFDACAEPKIRAGDCDESTAACGADL